MDPPKEQLFSPQLVEVKAHCTLCENNILGVIKTIERMTIMTFLIVESAIYCQNTVDHRGLYILLSVAKMDNREFSLD